MKIIVTFAVESEFNPWRRLRSFRLNPIEGKPAYETRIAHTDVHVILTGIGPRNASDVVRIGLDRSPDIWISSGLAGGLKPDYRVAEILVARAARSSTSFVKSDRHLFRMAVDNGARAVELFYTSEKALLTAAEKYRMGTLADAVEMESAAIMSETSKRGVPAVAIRAVADTAGTDLPLDFNQVLNKEGRISVPLMAAQIARVPHHLPALLHFSLNGARAARRLTRFLDQYVDALATQQERQEALFKAGAR